MADIFISYARSTASLAQQVAEALRGLGYGVWRDDELPAHRAYAEVIQERLAAAKAVVVIWSADATKSEWVQSEADRARGERKLVQLTVDGAALPMPFDRIQCADLTGWSGDPEAAGWRKVVASVAELVGRDAAPGLPLADAGPALPDRPSVAVLSLADLSAARDQAYFCDGMVEEITTALSRFASLFVVGASSGLSFRNSGQSPGEIARSLGVRYLLDGSVRRAGERVRITVKLADAVDNVPVWTERFDGTLEDVFALQDEVANAVAAQIEPAINAAEVRRSARRPTADHDAYDLYLRALQLEKQYEPDAFRQALALLDLAIQRDPAYARAVALAGYVHSLRYVFGYTGDIEESREQALALATRALRLDANDPDVLACAANTLANTVEDLEGAIQLAERALAANPGSSFAWYASGWANTYAGRPEPALRSFDTALRLDPRMPERHSALVGRGYSLLLQQRFAEAVSPLREAARLSLGNLGANMGLAAAFAHLGQLAEAKAALGALPPGFVAAGATNLSFANPHWGVIYAGLDLAGGA